ncbi:type II toxin-antitoxin system Phd/YefM family antitoxin [Candidatus Palauibacter sp.]|uniref:type II toxin-antitoxin system Phd/YefM family antitoxin n=1 Tax=Candidatus Palauibacter sp. TaxID=3101350 RepID=UPI003AF2743B
MGGMCGLRLERATAGDSKRIERTGLTSYVRPMRLLYSTYEAKARFSEVLRHVREGRTVTISYRGEPVAEIRPLRDRTTNLEERLAELERRGSLTPRPKHREPLKPGEPVPGALERFLADRGE